MIEPDILTSEEALAEIDKATKHRDLVLELDIQDDESYAHAQLAVKDVSNRLREIESERKEMVDPLNATKRKIDAFFKKWKTPYADIKMGLNQKLLEYNKKLEEQRELALSEARKAAISGEDPEVIKELVTTSTAASAKVSGVTFSNTWKAKVFDFAALPDEFKKVDQTKLDKFARENHDRKEVPGVEFHRERGIRS